MTAACAAMPVTGNCEVLIQYVLISFDDDVGNYVGVLRAFDAIALTGKRNAIIVCRF